MHALEWITEHGHHLRSLDAAKLRRALDRPRGTCTWCGEPVGRGRQTWCSPGCVEAFRLRCDPAFIRGYIERTRPLVCAICGRDIAWLKSLQRRAERAWHNLQYQKDRCRKGHLIINRRGRRNRRRQERWAALWSYASYHRKITKWLASRGLAALWEADHVVPVVEGGGCSPPENYRILCVPCHRAETAALAARRAETRRPKRTKSHHQTNLLET
jgi:hypothetical protein